MHHFWFFYHFRSRFLGRVALAGLMLLSLMTCWAPSRGFADEVGVAESPENSFKPERILGVTLKSDPRQVPGVKPILWNEKEVRVVTRYFGSSAESFLLLSGVVNKPNADQWNVIWNQREVKLTREGRFKIENPFHADLASVDLVLVGPAGEVEYHFYEIHLILPKIEPPAPLQTPVPLVNAKPLPSPQAPMKLPSNPVPTQKGMSELDFNRKLKKRLFVSAGLGVSSLSFSQTDDPTYRWTVATAKVSINYLILPPKWDLGFSGFFNFVTLSRSAPETVRFLGLNLRLGYIFPQIKEPWRVSLYGGWYYSKMISSNQAYGYNSVSGPQLFPSLRRNLKNGDAVASYFKFSPISTSLTHVSFSNHEIAFGAAYLIPKGSVTYGISLDYSKVSLTLNALTLGSSSLSLGGNLTF